MRKKVKLIEQGVIGSDFHLSKMAEPLELWVDGKPVLKCYKRKPRGFLRLLPALLFMLSLCCLPQANAQSSSYWLEDKSGQLTLEQILQRDLSAGWQKAEGNYPNFGFTNSTFWLSVPFENSRQQHTPMLLELAFPLHDYIDFYLLDGKKVIKQYQTGDQRPFVERPLPHRNFLFPHTVPPGKKLRAIIRLKSTDTMYLPVAVWESSAFFTNDSYHVLLLGVFFGFLLIMSVYNLLLYFSTQSSHYLYYVCCTMTIIYMQLTQKNLGYQYLWPEQPFFNHISVPLSGFLAIASSCFFILKFLNLKKEQYPKIILACHFFIWISLQLIAFSLFILVAGSNLVSYATIVLTMAVLGIAATISMIAMLTHLALRGKRSAQILSVAWLSLLLGAFFFALGRIGIDLPFSMLITENAMLIGSTLETALISMALAWHIKKERETRLQAQESALMHERKTREAQASLLILQRKTTDQLERKVKERTQKLETAMKSLKLANHKLDNLARVDGLTGLSNRREFDHGLEKQWLNCHKRQKSIALIMADIDHFKQINDNYGHLFGDQCLMNVGTILQNHISHPANLVARFGGEEFIIMLPDTSAESAATIAENIRRQIEQLSLECHDKAIHFTISLGISATTPRLGVECIDLIACADQALYLAKAEGRNKVASLEMPSKKVSAEPENILPHSIQTESTNNVTAIKPIAAKRPDDRIIQAAI